MLNDKSRGRKVSAKISKKEQNLMLEYIQNVLNDYTAEKYDKPFSVEKLFGGQNNDWHGTPLQLLYDKHVENNAKDPYKMAAIDAGHLLKKVLREDKCKYYESSSNGHAKEYWGIKEEKND
ncbi:MAG: hypothetical protein RSC93_11255 [Erysipelotrichaceae bacterium]